ncbi:alpha-L-rhamnosidase C-terminal domain-containing protein [Pedobacter heparinus]|uniref:Alpha-L-rhamnosidase n=1 Tax=Pedobacter heparinus (strain ATCC 13125 / DSM 2366 / CIP 104194 / JCM 7457 / NBRC 12017 / NCIMB 9290 / NRRL B-14731 / HIM 762-3) TaxID=485917 RepID=C6XVU2_PEDHD|nr:alpha-L-rhamnosidase C-terminal domain-containing protein [Pedobacter heparinus]ACU06167.1 alpha-L-rhamnosidase [Pedobacter heparinus DSM 2366]
MTNFSCIAKRITSFLMLFLSCSPFITAQVKSGTIVYPRGSFDADWISCPDVNLKSYGVFHMRKVFELTSRPKQFVVHVSGDQRYRLFANGTPVCFGPARGDLRNWNYETIDIAPYLKTGKNVLAVQLWNMGSGAPAAQLTYQTGFILQGNSNAEQMVNTNNSWRIIQNKGYFPEPFPPSRLASYIVGSCDSVVFKNYPFGWQNINYDDKSWLSPVSETKPRYYTEKRSLIPRSIPMMEEKIEPITGIVRILGTDTSAILNSFNKNGSITIPANTKATILFDRKTLTTAYPEITFSKGSNGKVKITYAESLFNSENLKGNRNEIKNKTIKGYYDVFLPDGGTAHTFRPLWTRTFRYIQFDITTGSEPMVIDKMQSVFTAYPFKEHAFFTSNDSTLHEIWDVSWRTARLCANETYMDCPYYEQLQYVGDTRIQALISLYVSGDDRLMRNAIEQFHQSQIPDGLTMDAYPAGGGKFIPPFSLFWIAMLHDFYWYRDDEKFIEKYLIPMEAILKWFEYRLDNNSGMLGKTGYWNFVDWSFSPKGIPSGGLEGNSSILSLQYVYALEQAAEIFAHAKQQQKADYYHNLGQKIKRAVYARCYDINNRLLADSPERKAFSQHANIWSIITDCIPFKDQEATMERIMNDSTLTATSLYYRFYYTKAMKKAGLGSLYLSSLRPWKQMLDLGFSTFPETLAPNVRSDCHAWSASPCYDFLATVCGIEPGTPGFATVRISPNLGNLKAVSGELPHPLGPIKVSYKKIKEGSYSAHIELPANLNGIFISKDQKVILTGGKQEITFKYE